MRLDYFDTLQGDDPDCLDIRNRLHEPADSPTDRVVALLPVKPCFFFQVMEIKPTFDTSDRVEFEKVRMLVDGTEFDAWRCCKDGRIYF